MHPKEVERIETNRDNPDESDTEHESDFHQQKLKEMGMEIGSENDEDTDYFPEGNLTKGVDNKTIRTRGFKRLRPLLTYVFFSLSFSKLH